MQQVFYFDTSVLGGVFDKEFEKESLLLFDKVKQGEIICMYSDFTETDLVNAPLNVRNYFKSLPEKNLLKVEATPNIIALATKYIEENVVGQTSFDDCVHIATATIHKADILVSWNFKHIVNIYRIRGYNAVNLQMNYHTLEIRSPKEIINHEN